uniref:Thioredoxin domain-containing protein n=1 Tax=Lotharella oceanica TaxID=641309 RepID=A0A7S2X7H0_9EUKA
MASRAMVTTITLMVSSLTCCLGGQAAAPKPASRGSVPLRVFHHHRNTASSSRFARAFLSPLPSSSARRPFAAPSAGIDPVDNKEEQGLQEGRGLVKMVTGEDFERHLHDDDRVAVVTFGMRSCRACKGFQRKFEKLGAKYDPSAFKFLKLNMVDGEPSEEVFQRYDITHTPSFLIFHKGEVLDRYQGISETRLKRTIDAAVAHLSGLLAPSESLGESPMMTRPAVAPQQDVSPGFSWQSASTPEPSEASAAAAVAQVAQSRVDSHLRRALAKADAMASEALETLDTPVTEIRRKSTTTRVKVPSEASSEQVAAVQLKQQLVEKMVHQDHGLREELEMMSDAVTQIRMRLVQSNRVVLPPHLPPNFMPILQKKTRGDLPSVRVCG